LGYESSVRVEVQRHREAQLAAMVEGEGLGPPEVLTFTGDLAGRARDQWLQRAVSGAGQRLAAQRDRVLAAAGLRRHHLALDLNASSGLLAWEALRRTPEGGVYALARTPQDAQALAEQAARLPDPERPMVLQGEIEDVPPAVGDLRFDAIVGRNALTRVPDKLAAARLLAALLVPEGVISLAEAVPRHTQRLYALIDLAPLGQPLASQLVAAEEEIYREAGDPMVNWDEEDLRAAFESAGLAPTLALERTRSDLYVTPAHLARWFALSAESGRPSYAGHLQRHLDPAGLAAVEQAMAQQLANRTMPWASTTAYLVARLRRAAA
jgi:putative ATPase